MSKSHLNRSRYLGYLTIMYYLIRRDLRVFREQFKGKLIDTILMLFTMVTVFGYFLPSYGLSADYGAFIFVGAVAGFGLFDVIGKVGLMIADMEGDRTILYTLTLPLPARLVFVYIAVSWAVLSSIIGILMFPIGKLLLLSQFDLSQISFIKLPLIFIMSNLFFGFFALWISGVLKKMSNLGHLFVRIINPLYSFGGFMYSWAAIYSVSEPIAYLHFINPLIYVMEGMRAATLGQEGYLPFWLSLGALTAFTVLIGWDAIRRLMKRLDCVKT